MTGRFTCATADGLQVNSGALPLELCTVPPGQIMRKQVPPEKTKDVLEFATKRPLDRLQSISNGLSVGRLI
jgi:eukaryotic translation initiation factor 2C